MIQFNVSQLLKEPVGSKRVYAVEESDPISPSEAGSIQGAIGVVTFMRTDIGILVNADLDSHAFCSCSRCLGTFSQPLHIHLEEEFLPTSDINAGASMGTSQLDDEDFVIGKDHILNLTEAMRQYAIVALPMKPLCKEDCAGICSSCGMNLNDGLCQCGDAQRDIRWSPLLELLSQRDSHVQ